MSNALRRLSERMLQYVARCRCDREHTNAGEWGEQQAMNYLKASGMRILGHRVRIGRRDELDIVARDGTELVFVEVKTRASEKYGAPIEAVNARKRHALSRGAIRYICRLRCRNTPFRFDVVEVIGSPKTGQVVIRHARNAFGLDQRYRVV